MQVPHVIGLPQPSPLGALPQLREPQAAACVAGVQQVPALQVCPEPQLPEQVPPHPLPAPPHLLVQSGLQLQTPAPEQV